MYLNILYLIVISKVHIILLFENLIYILLVFTMLLLTNNPNVFRPKVLYIYIHIHTLLYTYV